MRMGRLKQNRDFLPKRRQWHKVPSRWQDVAKDPPARRAGRATARRGNLRVPQGALSEGRRSPHSVPRASGARIAPQVLAPPSLVRLPSPAWAPQLPQPGAYRPTWELPLNQTLRPADKGESRGPRPATPGENGFGQNMPRWT